MVFASPVAWLRCLFNRSANNANLREYFTYLFASIRDIRRSFMLRMDPEARQPDDVFAAEHPVGPEALGPGARGAEGARAELTDRMIAALADHVINLERGRFSDSGRIGTVPGDVDRIFDELIPDEIKAAKRRGEKARILFYAHGGLVSETNALIGASQQLEFWRNNNVYPLFFIWETGFAETIRQIITNAGSRVARARGPLSWATDNLIEEVVRALQAGRVWGGMKSSAELASTGTGGATYVAAKTAGLLASHAADIEVHAVGHSAGAIFQAHFMPVLVQAGVPVTTAHYLAPAIRNDVFQQKVAPLLGNGIGPLTIFTMRKHLEKADTVTPAYRKSLLYLIYEALEERRQTDILGLEISLRGDRAARAVFGLDGQSSIKGDVIWSESRDTAAGGGSLSTTHGGFDNDPATMESVARRILKLINGQPIQPFPVGARGRFDADFWTDQMEWPDHLADMFQTPSPGLVAASTAIVSLGSDGAAAGPAGVTPGRLSGSRFALCIGIDRYAQSPLSGCVADARLWASTLAQLGYRTELMLDGAATSTAILERIRTLVTNARAGEHIIVQFSGHGTQFEDRDSDEAGGDTPALDECLCAIDLDDTATGGLVIDDELRAIFNAAPDGVEITCFFDCCHSGSATRATLQAAGSRSRTAVARKARFLPPTPNMEQAYRRRMHARKASRSRGPERQRDVLFSACRSSELAYEENGQGDFTRNATAVLAAGAAGITNSAFLDSVLQAFGSTLRQNPELHCEPPARQARFLAL
jgi:hypothetical protein